MCGNLFILNYSISIVIFINIDVLGIHITCTLFVYSGQFQANHKEWEGGLSGLVV